MKRIAFSLLSVVILLAMALPAGSAAVLAQPIIWPDDTQWMYPANCYSDPAGDEHPAQLDLIGNDTIGPAAYYYFGTYYAFFRERVVGDPSGPNNFTQNTWVVLFDLPEPGDYEYLLSMDGNNEKVQLWENTVRENLTWAPLLRDEAEQLLQEYPAATYARVVADGTGHYFVDWAIPLTDLPTNITASTTMYFCTSADANNFNKDHLVCYDFPDLVITEKSEAWVSLANKTYNVSYIVCNEGAAAPAGASNTTITIDGVDVLEDPVPRLAAGVCYNSTVGPFTMSGTNDTIMVCADNGDVVDESNEDNNCMENIFVCELPVANFTANNTNPCVNTPVQFTDLSTGTIDTWSWDVDGDGSEDYSTQNVTHTYTAPGNYTVNLTVENECGNDTESKLNYITVKAAIEYNLTVDVTPTDTGNVTINDTITPTSYPNTTTWDNGTVVNLTAVPDANYTFVNWTGEVADPNSPSTNVTMDGDKSVTAHFSTVTYNLTVISDGCCPIDVSGVVSGTVSAGGSQTFPGIGEGGKVTVSADDSAGCCKFDSWSDAGAQTHNITMNSDKSVTATCSVPGPFTITATAGANGNISPSGAVVVNCGANQTFNITADACYGIDDVVVDDSSVGAVASYTFSSVTANHTINATFAIRTYTITATAGANGNISPSGAVSVDCGANQTFNITADACYDIEDVVVDGSPVGAVASYTFTNVTVNHTISATFAIRTYTITATAGEGGNISPSGAVVVNCGANQTFNITADACYGIDDVVVDDSSVGAVASYTFSSVTANHTINATFAIRNYTITATAGANGNISPSGAVSVDCGDNQTFNITADACYGINDVVVDDSSVGAVASYTFSSVTANHTINATFAIKTYTITATAGEGGNISPSGAVSVDCGDNQTFNITADACYGINDVVVDDSSVGAVASYTFSSVTANHTINATFAIKTYTITATAGEGGNISPSGAVGVDCGDNQTFNITADACYGINDVVVDDSSVGAVASYTFSSVTANHTINATFAIRNYTITATAGEGGNISPSGAVSVDCGANQTFNITADACYGINDVVVDGSSVGAVASYTFSSVTANHTINATFSAITYDLTVNVSPGGGGNVTVNGVTPPSYPNTTTWVCGDNVTVNAVAASGYEFDHWSGDLSGNTTPTNITMNGDYSIVANFEEEHLPKICVDPESLPLTVMPNTTVTTTYTITNCGGGTLNWNSSNVTYDPNGNMDWLSQNITNGTLAADVSDTVLVTVNTTGLEEGTYNATITITGSTFTLPVILDVIPTIDVMRDLPGNNSMPNETYPGKTFDVYVNFTATANDFNAIGLTDVAPDGWEVQVNKTWCWINGSPDSALKVDALGNKAEIMLAGPFAFGTNISVMYKVTVPTTAEPGVNLFPNCNISRAWVEYYVAEEGPYMSCVWGDYKMIVIVPGDIVGETRDVNANELPDVDVRLHLDGATPSYQRSDVSTPDYRITVNMTGEYWLVGNLTRYYEINTTNGTQLPGCNFTIDLTTPELLAAGNVTDFEGNYGLIPRAPTMSYALKSVNLWLSPPPDHPEWALDEWKAMDVCTAWLYPS